VNLRRIGADFLVTARQFLRNPIGMFFALIFPIILVSIFGVIFSSANTQPTTVYTQNFDNHSAASVQFLSALNQSGAIKVDVVPTTAGNGNLSVFLAKNQYSAGLVVPAGFGAAFQTRHPIHPVVYIDPSQAATAGAVAGIVEGTLNQMNLRAAGGTNVATPIVLHVGSQALTGIDYLIPGLIGFSILTSPMFSLVDITSTYRKDGLFRQLSLTPLTKGEWLVAKILWYVGLTFVSAAIMVAVGLYLFHAHVTLSWGIVPFLVLGPFLFVSLGMLAGSAAKSPETAAVIGNVITFPMMFLSGTFFPVQDFSPQLQAFAHALPLYYVIDGMEGVMLYGNVGRALGDALVVLVLGVVIFVGAVIAFKWRAD
jgi:ABC-2 type transport system permease protein